MFNIYITLNACSFLVNQLQLLIPPSLQFRLAIIAWAMANLVVALGLEVKILLTHFSHISRSTDSFDCARTQWFVVKFVRKKYEQYEAAKDLSASKALTIASPTTTTANGYAPGTFSPSGSVRRRNTTSYSVDQEKLELGDYTPTIGGARVVSIGNDDVVDAVRTTKERQIPLSSNV